MKKYSTEFIRDFNWFIKMRHKFNFDGKSDYFDKIGNSVVVYDNGGCSAMESFHAWDSNGVIKPTKQPTLLRAILKTKGSVNLHIKMYAEDRACCNMSLIELRGLCIKFKAPHWFREAVERQKTKYWK